ncbi:NAD(P)-binding domain-containing protein [Rhodococcus sp. 27YEA15]|uniref:NAD(P)-binding domain-containing protein n=1 Tax=Rhodococcus sp. 27YEA15 TaxID=3156259 RepID=UPI003C7D158C
MQLRARKIISLDAPVSGGRPAAETRTLTTTVGAKGSPRTARLYVRNLLDTVLSRQSKSSAAQLI